MLPVLGSVYTGPDMFGTSTKFLQISLVFKRDLVDLVRIGSAIWYQMSPLIKVMLCGTIPFQFRTGPMQTEWIRVTCFRVMLSVRSSFYYLCCLLPTQLIERLLFHINLIETVTGNPRDVNTLTFWYVCHTR